MKHIIFLILFGLTACDIATDRVASHYLDPSCAYEYLTNEVDYTYKTYTCETKRCIEIFTLEDTELLNGRVVCLENPEVK